MKLKDYFNLGCKLFGVYFLFLSVPLFIEAITSFYPVYGLDKELENYFVFYRIVTRTLPFLYIFIGYQLIKNSERIFSFSYKETDEIQFTDRSVQFHFFLKMLGIYLIADYLPTLVGSAVSLLTYTNTPDVFDFLTQQQNSISDFVQSLIAIIFGLYLLKDGKHIVNFGFKSTSEVKDIQD